MASVFSRAKLFSIDTSISTYATTQAIRSQNRSFASAGPIDSPTHLVFLDDKMN
jgi:hypothetical protein